MKASPQSQLETAWARFDDGDSDGAAELLTDALESGDGELRGEALLLQCHILIVRGQGDKAAAVLAEAAPLLPEDGECLTDAANVALAIGDATLAGALSGRAIALDNSIADAAYARGLAALALEDQATARDMFTRTAELDASDPDPPWAMTIDEFAAVAEAALEELPAPAAERLENVPIIVEAAPSPELIADGIDPRLLGLFSGVPLTERSSIEPGEPALDAIHLFQRNLERSCSNRQELVDEIRVTVLHETAHFFGLEDEDLEPLGLA